MLKFQKLVASIAKTLVVDWKTFVPLFWVWKKTELRLIDRRDCSHDNDGCDDCIVDTDLQKKRVNEV
jgi:hypothetical protein